MAKDLCDIIIEYHLATAEFVKIVHKYMHEKNFNLGLTIEQIIGQAKMMEAQLGKEASEEIIDAGLRSIGALAKWQSVQPGKA